MFSESSTTVSSFANTVEKAAAIWKIPIKGVGEKSGYGVKYGVNDDVTYVVELEYYEQACHELVAVLEVLYGAFLDWNCGL
ncbi:hypothetical protein Tco_0871297 [Tanacetum coccineum]